MKKLALTLLALLTLTSCSGVNSASTNYRVPSDCNQKGVIAAFDAQVQGSKYVPTEWQPSPGSDLAAVYDNGGIACSYGIQTAEVGGTIMWASNKSDIWSKRVVEWKKAGQLAIDIPNLDESEAYILKEGSTSADEMHLWAINFLVGDMWIQIGATFLQNLDEAEPIIEAAVLAAHSH